MSKNKIIYGTNIFTDNEIDSGKLHLVCNLISAQLEANTFIFVVWSSDSTLVDFERNAKLTLYTGGKQLGIFYVQSIDRVDQNRYKIFATSAVGLLIEGQHMGGIYTGQTAQEVISSICGTVPFAVKHNLEEIKLYGWLPIASPRDNLAQVLFAIGAALKTDLDGVLRIEGLWDGIAGTVTRDDMYTDAAVDYDGKVTQVIVSEHQYVPWTEEQQLFEGTAQEGDVITFDEPMHTLTADGFTILASGANWAKVSAGSGVLSGKTYLHNTRQITKNVWPAQEPNVKTVKDATLVSLVNSQACAQRLADYYKCRERVDAPVVYHGELPGDRLATYHPFDKTGVAACLESADITMSNTLKAHEKSLVGFVPPKISEIQYYDKIEILTGSGNFVVPDGTTSILAILIGAGDGGSSGAYGEESESPIPRKSAYYQIGYYAGVGANGGLGGPPGLGGKVFQVNIDVVPSTVISYKTGKGGKGGVKNPSGIVSGSPGEHTIFGQYSSNDGNRFPNGFVVPVIDKTYSGDGREGIPGGKGAGASKSQGNGITIIEGPSVTDYSGNVWTAGYPNIEGQKISQVFNGTTGLPIQPYSKMGHGGGAAVGSNGVDGWYGEIIKIDEDYGTVYTGTTGKGADATKPLNATVYGKGGDGGHGGGGEGGSGETGFEDYTASTIKFQVGIMSGPGAGSDGADGGDGCIILFYRAAKKQPEGQLVDKNNKMILDRLGRRIIV